MPLSPHAPVVVHMLLSQSNCYSIKAATTCCSVTTYLISRAIASFRSLTNNGMARSPIRSQGNHDRDFSDVGGPPSRAREAILNFFYLFNQACSKHMDIQVVAELDDKYREGKQ
jgi:hypothetical protein